MKMTKAQRDIVPTGAWVEEHHRDTPVGVVHVSIQIADVEDYIALYVGQAPGEEHDSAWPYGKCREDWAPAMLDGWSRDDILEAVQRAALQAWREHVCDEECE